ncbi:integrase [Nocardioides luteus]|uniref:tyrosine-type recombinase/integrase n=2 Tax=Nocardioides luteus TaxID=1844 RepID=UPI002864EAB1|nr:site-specific integrase [Nocardioides luteus]MDR7313603.1 integrase [Nocardioides luteus]
MSVYKMPNGRWRARLKNGRTNVTSKVFDTQREAKAWLARERAALAGGVDPRAGKRRVRDLIDEWLPIRANTVAPKTYRADQDVKRLTPTNVLNMQVASVSDREIARVFERLLADDLAESSVVRYRASLSVFFTWCVREKYIVSNPVNGVKVPKQSDQKDEMNPFTEAELEEVYEDLRVRNPRLADVLLVLGWTGLRWGEARALTVADFVEVPTPGLRVRRSRTEGHETKSTKGRRSRRVPLANRVLPIVQQMTLGKKANDLLLTTDVGATLHRGAVIRTLDWKKTGQGRRLHDLRHTAACLWLARGVDVGTVKEWMGHESIATTNLYLHFLGTGADAAGLERLNDDPKKGRQNDPGATGGPQTAEGDE